jgi:ribosomal protein S18 acetylase RimI-like enzyme
MAAKASWWDSDLFGCRVGLLSASQPLSVGAIAEENRRLFDVVFVKSEGWAEPRGGADALDHLYDMELLAAGAAGAAVARRAVLSAPSPRHIEIARTAFHDSRFLRDRRLAPKAPELYARWVAGKEVHVLEGATDDAFLVAARDEDGARRISLVAVDEGRRGAGVGEALVSGVFRREPAGVWRVRVSARNHRAVRFYENLGFRVKSVRTAFHVWI